MDLNRVLSDKQIDVRNPYYDNPKGAEEKSRNSSSHYNTQNFEVTSSNELEGTDPCSTQKVSN